MVMDARSQAMKQCKLGAAVAIGWLVGISSSDRYRQIRPYPVSGCTYPSLPHTKPSKNRHRFRSAWWCTGSDGYSAPIHWPHRQQLKLSSVKPWHSIPSPMPGGSASGLISSLLLLGTLVFHMVNGRPGFHPSGYTMPVFIFFWRKFLEENFTILEH